ncbi:PssD/Cps14F family polysaccharide biosynthesis glycosyltransferase [Candidatus Thiothrix sp. Deng01]|uniref:PssD/Cps14F family polysaccharide biosynthesis glycosyltransferase n=1 Tax=Candidatus Thiothrix phosphatis TaxID=3112415 RepID=A0ABU6D0Q2_9GAMM|nr:PssD/Cps14F family polysaccharide biosynthesis glycosyltransferase [Candidatus Thiothrix sp. Deng01]MEB4592644.1 PssD/Cps14F family polysaccharide biosynthesis glycosyltransferase [Candidatus Thiothrix sp. Deng01]
MNISILLVYGEGGHHDQAMRLMRQMQAIDPKIEFIHVTDTVTMKADSIEKIYTVTPIRHKNASFNPFSFASAYLKAVALTVTLVHQYKPKAVIGFGPGICIPVFMVCKLLNVKKRIFFEDWCRFTSKSLSGKACSPFSTKFFVQNESLKELYRDAEFAGRL